MAKLQLSRTEFEKHIKLTPDIIDKIMMSGIPIEANKETVEIDVLPNRPDLLSMQNLVRTIKGFLGKETGLKKYKINPPEKDYRVKIDSSVRGVRPFTACAIIKNIKFDDAKIKEIIDLQEKLHTTVGRQRKKLAIGIYPLEKIKLPIKFEARKPGDIKFIPLEADREMTGLEILQRHPAGRDYAKLLEGYDKFPVFVDASGKILSMPPIINSHETGKITEKTKEVFIECSGFDLPILKKTLNIIITTFAEMSGKIYAMQLDYDKPIITPDLTPETMKINIDNVNKTLGLQLKESDLDKLLPKMGYDCKSGKVSIPAWRTDILHECDLIEDVAIAYGYEKLVPEIPKVATVGEESKQSKLRSKISEILAGL
ncbi:MAG: phenylalanine--tRNA ligase subunit beta, partial [archaeon]